MTNWGRNLRRAVTLEWHAVGRFDLTLIGIPFIVLLSRLPFLGNGFGNDPDAWRVASAARTLATTGRYVTSRLPGYPLQEMVYAGLWPASAFTFNLLTAIFSAIGVFFFARVLRRSGCKDVGLASLALAFTPIVFINSTNSMDYVWALALLMASFFYVLDRRPLVAGMFLGLAIGCRITSGAMLLPLSLILIRPGDARSTRRQVVQFVATSCLVGTVLFTPIFAVYGSDFLWFADTLYPAPSELLARVTVGTWGGIGFAVMLAAFASLLVRVSSGDKSKSLQAMQPLLRAACATTVMLYVVAFLRLPVEAGYLIPAIPVTIILMAAYLARPIFQIVCAALVITSFIIVGNPDIDQGTIWMDRRGRIVAEQLVERTIWLGSRLDEKSVVVVGPLFPQIEFTSAATPSKATFTYGIDAGQAGSYRARGYRIYFIRGVHEYNQRVYGVDLEKFGATLLRPSNRNSDEIE